MDKKYAEACHFLQSRDLPNLAELLEALCVATSWKDEMVQWIEFPLESKNPELLLHKAGGYTFCRIGIPSEQLAADYLVGLAQRLAANQIQEGTLRELNDARHCRLFIGLLRQEAEIIDDPRASQARH